MDPLCQVRSPAETNSVSEAFKRPTHGAARFRFGDHRRPLFRHSVKRFAAVGMGLIAFILIGGCGTHVPLTDPLRANSLDENNYSREGRIEQNLVGNIRCEIQNAVYEADKLGSMPYLGTTWGTQVTLKLTWDEMSGLAPSVSIINPLAMMQSFAVSLGASATAHATRLETITFLFENRGLLAAAKRMGRQDCSKRETGIMIESDLRIEEFIYDKATVAATAVATTVDRGRPQFSTFQEDLTFVATLSGNVTPVWKLTRVSANTSGNLI